MTDFSVTLDAPGYYSLAAILQRAFDQASKGKGKERHANELPFDQQPMQTIARAHGVGFLTGQASKKAEEAHGLPHGAKVAELLGAINYLAGAVLFLEAQEAAKVRKAQEAGAAILDLEHQLGTIYMTTPNTGGGSPSKHAAQSNGIVESLPSLHNRRSDDHG